MKSIFGWIAAGLLAGTLAVGAQTQGQNTPRGVDKDGDGKCDVCGRPASQIGQGRRAGGGMGRGFRGGRGMCRQQCQCPNCQTKQQTQGQPQQQKN